MNKEEQEAKEYLEGMLNMYNNRPAPISQKALKILVNLIEKQQKEIEELKHDNSILCEIAYTGKRIQLPYTMVYTGTDNFISKDKIREKIKELEKESFKSVAISLKINVLKELLEENNND